MTRIVRQEQFPAYRAQIVSYLVSYLSYRSGRQLDLERVWGQQEISEELRVLIKGWSHQIQKHIVDTSNGRNVTEWCKKEDCWKAIRSLNLAFTEILPAEIGEASAKTPKKGEETQELSHEDLENIYTCQKLSAFEWIQISEWGQRTKKLQHWEWGIAHTLSGYAAGDWSKQPSVKQAKHGARMVKLAEDEGLFLVASNAAE